MSLALSLALHVKTQTCAQNKHSQTQFRGRAHASRNAQSHTRTWARGRGTHETRWGCGSTEQKNDVSESSNEKVRIFWNQQFPEIGTKKTVLVRSEFNNTIVFQKIKPDELQRGHGTK